ncbi:MAG: TonB-dependent receptor [Calditrichaeota bacterium]|nr:TonB-dependent receptor [Calditrichota bacterium]
MIRLSRRIIFLLIFVLTIVSNLPAQKTVFSGRVIDEQSGEPLSGADVYFQFLKAGTTTDDDGFFKLSVSAEISPKDSLIVDFLGYRTVKIAVLKLRKSQVIYLRPLKLQLKETIEVEAERLNLSRLDVPHKGESVLQSELQRYASSELSDILKKFPSVRLEGNEIDGKQIQIRGSNSNEINVYLDGILLNDLSGSNAADLSIVPVDNISRIEIHKSAHLLLTGGGAFGGVINLVTRQPSERKFRLKSKIGSFMSRRYSGSVDIPFGKNFAASYYGQYSKMNPEIEYFPDERISFEKSKNDNIRMKKSYHYLNLFYHRPSFTSNLKLFYYNLNYKKPGWHDSRTTFLLGNQYQLPNAFNLSLSYIRNRDEVQRYQVKTSRNLYQYDSQRLNVRVAKSFKFKRGSLQSVSEYWHERLTRKTSISDSGNILPIERMFFYDNRLNSSLVYSFNDRYDSLSTIKWRVFFGLRGDVSASGYRDFTNSWGAKINWRKNNHLFSAYLSYGRNARYPTLFEIAYNQDFVVNSLGDTSKASLEPEYSQSYDMGITVTSDFASFVLPQIQYDFSFFYRTIYNKLLKQPFGEYIIQSQLGRNRTSGFEASVRFKNMLGFVNIQAALTRLYISDRLLYEYKPDLSYNLQAELIRRQLYFSANYFYEGKSYGWYFDKLNRLRTNRLKGFYDLRHGFDFRISDKNRAAQAAVPVFGLQYSG